MSPRMDADFSGWGDVQASTPIYPKGRYELTIKRVRGRAWFKRDEDGNPTDKITQAIFATPEIVGAYDSAGDLQSEIEVDGKVKEVAGEEAEEIAFWLHSKGGREMSKRQMMAIAGYNPNDPEEEKEFDQEVADFDLGWSAEENELGDGIVLKIGGDWESLLVGKSVVAVMEPEQRDDGGLSQNYKGLYPVGS